MHNLSAAKCKNKLNYFSPKKSYSTSSDTNEFAMWIFNIFFGFWTEGLLRIPEKCEGNAKGDAKGGAKEVS